MMVGKDWNVSVKNGILLSGLKVLNDGAIV
jgi:hypothetical protein